MACAGCGASPPTEQPRARTLPPAPDYARPVKLAPLRESDDQLVVAARERAGRAEANDRISCFAAWYSDVKRNFGQAVAEQGASALSQACAVMVEKRK